MLQPLGLADPISWIARNFHHHPENPKRHPWIDGRPVLEVDDEGPGYDEGSFSLLLPRGLTTPLHRRGAG